jgi:hypothetical protein
MKKCFMGFAPVVEYLQMKRSSKNIISILVSRLLGQRHFADRHLVNMQSIKSLTNDGA